MTNSLITVVSMSRRFEGYQHLVKQLETQIPDLIGQYLVFVNDDSIKDKYRKFSDTFLKIKLEGMIVEQSKVRPFFAGSDFVFKHGHDFVYNYLEKNCFTDYILKVFDTDEIVIDPEKFKQEFTLGKDLYGIPTWMARGDSSEIKYQLYKKDLFKWIGAVHENQEFFRTPTVYDLKGFSVFHRNAVDEASKNVEKNKDGFIILKKVTEEENKDSYLRNLLYESLAYRIVYENLPHQNAAWFKQHYQINKEVIDYYYNEALKRWSK